MQDTILAVGRGIVKVLIGLFIGFGVSLVVVGYFSMQNPSAWDFERDPPVGELLLGIGAGLLTSGLTLSVLFFNGCSRKALPPASD
jgi:hypothetical protein